MKLLRLNVNYNFMTEINLYDMHKKSCVLFSN